MFRSSGFALVLILSFSLTPSLSAQFTCEGTACGFLPSSLTEKGNSSLRKFEKEYLGEVLETNLEAAFLANLGANHVGTGLVRRFQFGVGASASGYRKEDIQVKDDTIRYPKLPNVGGAVSPAITLDFNPGWILGFDEDSFFRRFSVFLHGMNVAISQDQIENASNNRNFEGRITARSYGGALRFQLVEKTGFFLNLLTWNGLNLGVGHHFLEQNLRLQYLEGKAAEISFSGVTGKWGGDTNFLYQTKAITTHVDVRTGFGFFWVANLIVGGGYSWNSGDNSVSLSRKGPFIITPEGSAFELPREFQEFLDKQLLAQNPNATLGLQTSAQSRSRRGIGYGILGLEFDLYLVKVIAEVMSGGKDLYSANLGVKISF